MTELITARIHFSHVDTIPTSPEGDSTEMKISALLFPNETYTTILLVLNPNSALQPYLEQVGNEKKGSKVWYPYHNLNAYPLTS